MHCSHALQTDSLLPRWNKAVKPKEWRAISHWWAAVEKSDCFITSGSPQIRSKVWGDEAAWSTGTYTLWKHMFAWHVGCRPARVKAPTSATGIFCPILSWPRTGIAVSTFEVSPQYKQVSWPVQISLCWASRQSKQKASKHQSLPKHGPILRSNQLPPDTSPSSTSTVVRSLPERNSCLCRSWDILRPVCL